MHRNLSNYYVIFRKDIYNFILSHLSRRDSTQTSQSCLYLIDYTSIDYSTVLTSDSFGLWSLDYTVITTILQYSHSVN